MRITARFESRTPALATKAAPGNTAHAARNLALAYRLQQLIDQGLVADYAAAARLLRVSQPRLTHLMSLVLLAPQLQEAILLGSVAPGDKQLRCIARTLAWDEQLASFAS